MSSHNNLHKLRRLTNTLDLKGRYSTLDPERFADAVKLPALNCINKSVKHNDISFTFSRDLSKLRKEPQSEDHLAESLAHSSMLTVRRKYDTISKDREQEENHIKELEAERKKYQTEKDRFENEKAAGLQKVKDMEEELRRIKVLSEEGDMEKKVMLHMMSRLKSDRIFSDQLKYDKEMELSFMGKNREIILRESTLIKEDEDRTKKVFRKLVQHIEEDEKERNIHVNSMNYMIENRVQAFEGSLQKKAEMKEIAEITLSEKDPKQKNWYKVYLCQRFVEKMLKDKIDREMTKFSSVEEAFKTIKTATGVSKTEALVEKFLNKETTYGIMLGKIAEDERRIVEMKAESEVLHKEHGILKTEKGQLSIKKVQGKDLTQEQKQFEKISEKASKDYLFQETLKLWLHRNLKKFYAISGQGKMDLESSPLEAISYFKNYLLKLQEQCEQNSNSDDLDVKPSDEGVSASNNKRINPDHSQEKLKSFDKGHQSLATTHLTHHGQQIGADNQSENNEQEHIEDIRGEMFRSNEKFMRQIKKKYEEIRKLRVDAEPKKKEPSPERQKVPAADL